MIYLVKERRYFVIYSKLSRFYFVFSFVFICFGCCSKITNARMHGKVATIEDIGRMLDEFKSYYKDTFFSEDEKTREWAWGYEHRGRHVDGILDEEDLAFLESCREKSNSNGLFDNKALKHLSCPVVDGKDFTCHNVSSWCLRWLESKNFICGLLLASFRVNPSELHGFHWCVMVPVLDSAQNLDMYVCELCRYNPKGYTKEKVLFHWREFGSDCSWTNFVIVRNNEIYNSDKDGKTCNGGEDDKACNCDYCKACILKYAGGAVSAVSAPIWVWNVMKSLSGRGRCCVSLSARNWLLKESKRIVDDMNNKKIDYRFWPYIVPFGKEKKFGFDMKMIGKVSDGILQVPSIMDSNFNVRCFPESRWAVFHEIEDEYGMERDHVDWADTKFYLLRDPRFVLKGVVSIFPKDGEIGLPVSLKTNKEASPEEFFSGGKTYFKLLTPEPNEIFDRNSKNHKKIMCRSESAREYNFKLIDECYSVKPYPKRRNEGLFTILLELFEYSPYDLFGYQ